MQKVVYEHAITVTPADIDALGHVNNVVYLRWVQEAAEAHWKHLAPPAIREPLLWVVLRHEIDYRKPAFLNDHLTARTWIGKHSGATSERFVTIVSGERVLAEARTMWCMLDAKSMRPMRISGEILQYLPENGAIE
jgi:acyl-CoA thioester hydrolase